MDANARRLQRRTSSERFEHEIPFRTDEGGHMTLCPVAIAIGCRKCPVFTVCPVKGIIGDYKPDPEDQAPASKNAPGPDADDTK